MYLIFFTVAIRSRCSMLKKIITNNSAFLKNDGGAIKNILIGSRNSKHYTKLTTTIAKTSFSNHTLAIIFLIVSFTVLTLQKTAIKISFNLLPPISKINFFRNTNSSPFKPILCIFFSQ